MDGELVEPTVKQLLAILIIEHGVLLLLALKYVWPRIVALDKLIANQAVLNQNDKSLHEEIGITRSAALNARDSSSDTKQSVETLNSLLKEAVRNLPKKDGLA